MNVRAYNINDEPCYVYDSPDDGSKVYRPVGITDNPRVMATHGGQVLLDGTIVSVEYEGGLFNVYHDWIPSSSLPVFAPEDFVSEPAVLIERVWPTGETGGWA